MGGSFTIVLTPGASLLPAGVSAVPSARKLLHELLGDAPWLAQSCDSPAALGTAGTGPLWA